VLWPAIFDASMLDPPTSCLQVMLARRKECVYGPSKSQPSAAAARFSTCRNRTAAFRAHAIAAQGVHRADAAAVSGFWQPFVGFDDGKLD
jgi:hypothetical protein